MNVYNLKINFKFFINLILFALIFIFFHKYLVHLSIFDIDDLNSTYSSYPLWREENGRYVCHILSRLFCLHIPNILGIHIQDAVNSIGMFCYVIILGLLFTSVASFCEIKRKNNFLYIIFWIISFLLFIKYFLGNVFYSTMVTFQYGYVLATVFGLVFILQYFKILMKNNYFSDSDFNISNFELIFIVIMAFCSGNSNQIVSYSVGISIFLNIFVIIFKNKFNFKKLHFIFIEKKFFYPIGSYLAGLLLMVLCPGFWNEVSWRHVDSFSQVLNLIIPFTKEYIEVVIKWHSFELMFIFFLSVFVIITILITKKEKIKDTLSSIFTIFTPIIGIMCYHFMLILGGKTFPSEPKTFWLIEPFYGFVYTMFLCSIIAALFGYLISYKKIIISIATVFLILFIKNYELPDEKNFFEDIKKHRENMYIVEKLIMTSVYQNKDIIIPKSYRNKYTILFNNNDINRCIKSAYGIDISDYNISVEEDKLAFNYYYSIGGFLTDEEKEKTKFQNLFNKDYVLKNIKKE